MALNEQNYIIIYLLKTTYGYFYRGNSNKSIYLDEHTYIIIMMHSTIVVKQVYHKLVEISEVLQYVTVVLYSLTLQLGVIII